MFIVKIESFTWIALYDVIMQDIVYMMIWCKEIQICIANMKEKPLNKLYPEYEEGY